MIHSPLCIKSVSQHETIVFAAQELKKYLSLIHLDTTIDCVVSPKFESSQPNVIWIGTFAQLHIEHPVPDTTISSYHDAIHIDISPTGGIIAGHHPRSVLIAVYRYLRHLGFRWFMPGPEGEVIPTGIKTLKPVQITEVPSYHHRGVCIEGAVSYEHVRQMIDWLPKAGFNSYFIQFREAYTFFDRWYSHLHNPSKPKEPFDIEKARELIKLLEAEIEKRDLIYHAVGHGWTCEPLGIPGLSWEPKEYELTPEQTSYLAMVNGKRQIWHHIALNTNLCYSNPEVQHLMINEIVRYLESNPQIDLLHFWLADSYNNQCECENCQVMIPTDFYVQMLNELDQRLTAKNIDTKIVFLIYYELLWPPMREQIQHQDRFVLMFAPITRTYSEEFKSNGQAATIPPYVRNQLQFPSSTDEYLAFLKGWQRHFTGDSFAFDYHMMWDHFFDPGFYATAQIIHKDIRNLQSIGLKGYMSCQVQRAFFPNGLNMNVMAETLWNKDVEFEELVNAYYEHAYGNEREACKQYFQQLSKLFDPPYLRYEKPLVNIEQAAQFASIPSFIEQFLPVIERNRGQGSPFQQTSWEYLWYHAHFSILFAKTLEAKALGDQSLLTERWEQLKQYIQTNEDAIQSGFDVYEFIHVMRSKIMEEFKFLG